MRAVRDMGVMRAVRIIRDMRGVLMGIRDMRVMKVFRVITFGRK
jgi:hypothetical protein